MCCNCSTASRAVVCRQLSLTYSITSSFCGRTLSGFSRAFAYCATTATFSPAAFCAPQERLLRHVRLHFNNVRPANNPHKKGRPSKHIFCPYAGCWLRQRDLFFSRPNNVVRVRGAIVMIPSAFFTAGPRCRTPLPHHRSTTRHLDFAKKNAKACENVLPLCR